MAVTIRDVAKEAGTTIGTVSKAMNNSYTISGEMTAHVKAVAERLGYRPNARAQSFSRRANRDVAFLTYLPRDIGFTNPHMFEILVGAEAALREKGYSVKLYSCDADNVCHLVKEAIDTKMVDGLLLHASVVTRELAVLLGHTGAAHIVIGKPDFGNSLCWIDNNNKFAGEVAAAHIYEQGHREIVYFGGTDKDHISTDRLKGIKYYLEERGISSEDLIVYQGESSLKSGSEMTAKLLSEKKLPPAIICANNLLAFGCLKEIQRAGLNVPGHISLMTFDDYPLAQLSDPALTTVSINVYDMGVSAGKLLVKKIKRPELKIQTYTTMPELTIRGSTGAR
ncbi:MAG: LacI family transcriptional regulator [Lachnospiraceae bacterium]|nr:LacI family transcriptional regulator [Lachnospiraceae bacterium]